MSDDAALLEEEIEVEQPQVERAEANFHERTVPKYPSSPEDAEAWRQLLLGLRVARTEEKPEPPGLQVLMTGIETPITTSPKKYIAAAVSMGWQIHTFASLVWHPPVYQLKDGKMRKDGTQVLAGQETSPAREKIHLKVEARHKIYPLGFQGFWVDGRFEEAVIFDPVGLSEPLEFDYQPIRVNTVKGEVDESYQRRLREAQAQADECNAQYNDGELWTVHSQRVTSGDAFNQWLDEWMERLAPDAKRLTIKRKVADQPQASTDEDLLGGQEWTG